MNETFATAFGYSLLTLLVSYLIGSIPTGYIIGKCKGMDIREHGSGNIGATNVTRVIGKWWGKACFLGDFLKGALPVILTSLLIKKGILTDSYGVLPSLAAFITVAGHVWPIYLKFKGGKGISTAAGAVLALNPPALLGAGLLWVILFLTSRYVSLASIFAALSLPLFAWGFLKYKVWNCTKAEMILFGLLALLAVLRHISNIKRLLNGTESRFERKKKNAESMEEKEEKQ